MIEVKTHSKISKFGDFLPGSVAKTPYSQCKGPGFDPLSGN